MSKFSEELENLTKKQRDIANAKKAKKEYPTGVTWSEKVVKAKLVLNLKVNQLNQFGKLICNNGVLIQKNLKY